MNIKKNGKNYLYYSEDNTCDQIVDSWDNTVNYVVEDLKKCQRGLREAQLGAIFAIRAHWIVNDDVSTVVMPTGTGKTETMITTIVAEQFRRVFILVPSDLLRKQTAEACAKLGILKEIGVIKQSAKFPRVLLLKSQPQSREELEKVLCDANIIVSTAALVSKFDDEYMKLLSDICNVLIVDEAHHIEATRWNQIKAYFKRKRILQFTATPFRNDGKKIDGNIIYNFPLAKAQKQGYFQKIDFKPIIEFDDELSDVSIATAAVNQLKADLQNGYDHIILVRAKTVLRAKQLYEQIYLKKFKEYHPVLIIGEMHKRDKDRNMSLLKKGEAKIVICVDMFGEGIDIPNLKIAAIHDKYKSLPITLQFVGRFARSKKGVGNATIITNLANEDIQNALSDLYSQDSDWNYLLSELSDARIDKEISLQQLACGFKGNGIAAINIKQLHPALSMVAFNTGDEEWNWGRWNQLFNEDLCKYYINEEQKIFIVVEPEESRIEWANYQEVNDLNWNLHIAYWNREKKVLFINSTNKSICNKFAETLFENVQRIRGEEIFKCLYGINRLMLANVGLNSAIDGPIRYKMFTGIDIAEAISESQKGNCYKSNLFGQGYNGAGKMSIGCSYKGTVWGRLVEPIDVWRDWCDMNLDKICNPDINVVDVLKGVLTPEIIKERPKKHPYRIDWPNELDVCCEAGIYVETPYQSVCFLDITIGLIDVEENENIQFYVKNDDFIVEYELIIDERGWTICQTKGEEIYFCKKTRNIRLVDYFRENPPEIKFVDQSSLQGNMYVTLQNSDNFKFCEKQIICWEWNGVNINKESQGLSKDIKSIQYFTIQQLLKMDYDVIFDDDSAGEIADIVTIKEMNDEICFEFYHCKYAHGEKPGGRVSDLYEVCGQAEKSVLWKSNMLNVLDRIKYREGKRMRENGISRFEKGDLKKIAYLKNKLKFVKSTLNIYIVQPGISKKQITYEMNQILCGAQAYLLDTYGITLNIICSN